MKTRKLLWIILPITILVCGSLVYLFSMPSIVGVAKVLLKATVTDRETYGCLLKPLLALEPVEASVSSGTVLSQYGFSVTIPSDVMIQAYNKDEPTKAYQVADGKAAIVISPEMDIDTTSMRSYFQFINKTLEDKYGLTIEETYGASLDTEYQCYRMQYGVRVGDFSLTENKRNLVILDLIKIFGMGKPDGHPVYVLDQGDMKGFLMVNSNREGKMMVSYSFFHKNNLNREHTVCFIGNITLDEAVAIISTIRFDEEAHS